MGNISELSWKIYNEEPVNQSLREYYLSYLPEIKKFGKYDFLVENFGNFTVSSNLSLMLVLPELWNDFNIDDWIELFERNKERPMKIKASQIDTGKFSDVVFFCKYLELDGIDLFINYSNSTINDKQAVLNYTNIFHRNLTKDKFDVEAIDGTEAMEIGYEPFGCDIAKLNDIKTSLLTDKRAIEFPKDIEQTENYIKKKYLLENSKLYISNT